MTSYETAEVSFAQSSEIEVPAAASEPLLRVRNLTKRYRGDVGGVRDIDLEVGEGEILTLLGPSGSGKSTILKCIAGLEHPEAGEITVGPKVLSSSDRGIFLNPEKRGLAMVFQSLALWPHMSVFDNVAYPLVCAKVSKDEIRERVVSILELVGCAQLIERRPSQISGGEQQRVACARALVGRPSVVLFDEPFSSVDARLRSGLRRWLLELREETGLTGVFVTHDQAEAAMVGDHVAVLFDGDMAAFGDPRELHEHPTDSRVATFLGPMNLWPGTVASVSETRAVFETSVGALAVDRAVIGGDLVVGQDMQLGIRPQQVVVTADRTPRHNLVSGVVSFARFVGAFMHYEVEVGDTVLEAFAPMEPEFAVGERVQVGLPSASLRAFADHHA